MVGVLFQTFEIVERLIARKTDPMLIAKFSFMAFIKGLTNSSLENNVLEAFLALPNLVLFVLFCTKSYIILM